MQAQMTFFIGRTHFRVAETWMVEAGSGLDIIHTRGQGLRLMHLDDYRRCETCQTGQTEGDLWKTSNSGWSMKDIKQWVIYERSNSRWSMKEIKQWVIYETLYDLRNWTITGSDQPITWEFTARTWCHMTLVNVEGTSNWFAPTSEHGESPQCVAPL